MAFTYNGTFATTLDEIRFEIGDTQVNEGPRPDGRNFADAEISFIEVKETYVNATIAHLFETLASEWTQYAISEREGDVQFDAKGVADLYRKRAAEWRRKENGGGDQENTLQAGVIGLDFMEKDDE